MQWEKRPVELANLINPAFCSVLLWDSINNFKESEKGIDFALLFLVLPLVLHKETRTALPARKQSSLVKWIEKHHQMLVLFPAHVKQMVPYTREAILFGLQHGVLVIEGDFIVTGTVKPTTSSKSKNTSVSITDSEPEECRKKAGLIGFWFAEIGDSSTIYRLFGIRP